MMKKAADKSAVRWSSVIFAALFFFLASLSGSLWYMQKTDGVPVYDETARSKLVSDLYEERVQTLADKMLSPILNADKEIVTITIPEELNQAKTYFRYSVEGMVNPATRKKLETITEDENLKYVMYKTASVNVRDASGKQEVTVYKTVKCALVYPMDKNYFDAFRRVLYFAHIGAEYENVFWMVTIISGALALLFCALLLLGALREGARIQGAQRMFNVLPPDLYVCCVLPALVILYMLLLDVIKVRDRMSEYLKTGSGEYGMLLWPVCMTIVFALILILLVLVVYSVRRGGIQCLFAFRRFQQIAFSRRTMFYLVMMQVIKAASVGLYLFATSIYYSKEFDGYRRWVLVFLLLEKLVTLPVIFRTLRQLRAVMDKTAQFVEGDLSGTASNANDYATLRTHGADVDTLVQRIKASADEYIQSSNFKAELITNLSHDIKTPLTSIINYAQLLKREDLTPEDRVKYLHVLQRHSGRLQKLVDDLSEVSDAASGNVPVALTVVDLCSTVQQAVPGFEERLSKQGITIRLRLPKQPVFVKADPRLLQRVTDNLMNNICKYSRFGSEVQIAVVRSRDRAAAIFRNRSDRPMQLSGEELMERFVREDDARHTDGSGLGLSIAQSLMKLQGGKLWLHTEDDIFVSQLLFRKL